MFPKVLNHKLSTFWLFFLISETVSVLNFQYKNVSTTMCTPHIRNRNVMNPPDCVIKIETDFPDENDYTCVGFSALKVGVDQTQNPFEIVCTATYKMVVDVNFLDGYVSENDARFQTESFFSKNTTEPIIGNTRITIKPQFRGRRSIKYRITGNDNMETVVLLVYRSLGAGGTSRVYWLPDRSNRLADLSNNFPILIAASEIILIPCVPYGDNVNVLFIQDSNTETGWSPLPADGSIVKYDPSSGFFLNTTLYPNYANRYRCWAQNYYEFGISDLEDLVVFPKGEDLVHYTHQSAIISDLRIECSHAIPVKLEGTILFSNGSKIIIRETNSSMSEKPKLRYTVHFQDENLKPKDQISLSCINSTSEQILHTWNILIQDIQEKSAENNKLRLDQNDQWFYCSSDTFDDANLKWMTIHTWAQYQQIGSCIEQDVRHPCYQYSRVISGLSTNCRYEEEHANTTSCEGLKMTGGGVLLCSAGNGGHQFVRLRFSGKNQIQYFYDQDVPEKAKIIVQKMHDPEAGWETYLRTKVEYFFECRSHRYISDGDFHWLLEFENGTRVVFRDDLAQITYDERIHLFEVATASTRIIFFNTGIVNLVCRSPTINPDDWIEAKLNVSISASESPRVLTRDKFEFKVDAVNQIIVCEASGFPTPRLNWSMANGHNISEALTVDGGTLIFPKFESFMSDIYICNATNVDGYDAKEIQVSEEQDKSGLIIGITVGVSVLIIIVIIIAGTMYYRRKRDKLNSTEIDDFFNGETGSDDSDDDSTNGLYTHATNRLPYPIEFEILKERLIFDKTKLLGSGEFGEVYHGNCEIDQKTMQVAVKVPKPECPTELFKMLLSELKIMTYIGEHENVVRLIGAYTAEIRKGVLLIAIEYCELGSLEEFLETNQEKYGNQNAPEIKPPAKGGYLRLDEVASTFVFDFADLVQWSYEIAAGMEFLANKKIIHADLASRNVLLTAGQVAKIADFGLSRRLYHYENYIKSTQVALPWRWMAVESLTAKVFSTQSDVWSFGITLWEIFSLGNFPYPGLDWDITFGNQLKNGLRNIQPGYATPEIYDIMVDCWREKPEDRPSFSKLESKLNAMCSAMKLSVESKDGSTRDETPLYSSG